MRDEGLEQASIKIWKVEAWSFVVALKSLPIFDKVIEFLFI